MVEVPRLSARRIDEVAESLVIIAYLMQLFLNIGRELVPHLRHDDPYDCLKVVLR